MPTSSRMRKREIEAVLGSICYDRANSGNAVYNKNTYFNVMNIGSLWLTVTLEFSIRQDI